ncbi:15-hydroxyprostaglandin dehydrogenase [NAD(+)]-like [Pieris napi]|uniref:15-hydroxyprostaglandin dehydrogenase [NAD(+)]-like n=1 Tax=Pieris napi TaxID=78633 RepID=UPI001FB8FD01|nr:15-hydroxyprostaglandin dehydrogenase [NAD(+)]-like [Pieris napi]
MWDIKDKTFLITGGASGLGAQYAKTFLQLGAKKVAILDVAETVGVSFVTSLNETYPGKAVFIKCDVGNEDDIKGAFQKALNDLQRLDVIINNAGIMSDSPDLWRKSCEVNWQGLVSFTMKGVESMRTDEGGAGGTIINIASTAALFKLPTMPVYCGSKLAVIHFSQSLAEPPFFERTGVRILTMCPGPTDTPLLHNLLDRAIDKKYAEDFYAAVPTYPQEVESAVNAVVKMYQEGDCGSIWLSVKNKPAQDITDMFRNFYIELAKVI